MKKLFLTLLLFCCYSSFSQFVQVNGSVIAEELPEGLGQIVIFSLPDSTLKKGGYMESSAFNILLNAKQGSDYYLRISAPGFSDHYTNFTVNAEDTAVSLGLITLEKNINLDAVDIVYKKAVFERTMDGISVNVEGTNLQNLTNLFEVLKASPRLTSPDDERIEIIGKGSPLILVDRQAIISNDELKAIPADQIEKIEIITTPSAKYRAQGTGNGVIEVYTKNFHLEGYNMTVSASGGINTQKKPTGRLNTGLSLKKEKFSLSGYLGGNYNEANSFGSESGFTTDGSDRTQSSNYDSEDMNRWQYYNVKAAYNINEDQKLTFGVNGNGSKNRFNSKSTILYAASSENQIQNIRNSNTSYTWLNNSAFLNYTFETDTNHSALELNLNYVNKASNQDGTINGVFENFLNGSTSAFNTKNESKNSPNIGEFRANYEHIFDTTGWKLSFGTSYSLLLNGKKFNQFDLVDEDWVVNSEFTNSYDYQEHIGGLFVEAEKKWKKFGVRAGLRAEYTKLNGFSNSLNKTFIDSSYILPFPSASIMYEVNDKVGLKLFYNSGIDRPQFSNYDPFVRIVDSLSIQYGNPLLRPAIEQSIGLDIDLFYAYNLSVSYFYKKNPSSNLSFVDDQTFLVESTPWNADYEEGISGSLSLPFQKKWLQGWNSIWFSYSKYNFTADFNRQPFLNLTYGVYSYLTFTLPKDFSLMNRFHINKWGNANQNNNANVNWGMRLTKKYKGNNFQIYFDVSNIIPNKRISEGFTGNFQSKSINQNNFTSFKLGLFYKFGRLRSNTQIKESSSKQSNRL